MTNISDRKLSANRNNSILGGNATAAKFIQIKQKYNQNPKLCKCCQKPISYEKRSNTYCSQSCAATSNNTGKIKVQRIPCKVCGKESKTGYCSKQCSIVGRTKYSPAESALHKKQRSREISANYRAKVRNQTPPNADRSAMREFYKNCPAGYEVDHIIPISKGGLHSIENLQYLTITENRRKSNKI